MVTYFYSSEHLSVWQAGWMSLRGHSAVWCFFLALSFSMWPYALFTMSSLQLFLYLVGSFIMFMLYKHLPESLVFPWLGEGLGFLVYIVSWASFIFLIKSWVVWFGCSPFQQSLGHPTSRSQHQVIFLGRGTEVVARQTIKSKTNPFPIDRRLHFGSGMNLKTN